jgi:hypothetical protein
VKISQPHPILRWHWLVAHLLVVSVGLAGCGAERAPASTAPVERPTVAVEVVATSLQPSRECSGAFVAHRLDFTTGTRLRAISTYISNGAGVAANDLDNDGDLDLVFASVDREAEIFWNDGSLVFTSQTLDDRFGRGVAIVDVDADGWNDIVFTHRGLDGVSFWRNQGGESARSSPPAPRPSFALHPLPGVDSYAYAMAWGDVDGDGDLDLVTGSYGVELLQHGIDLPAADPRAGVVLHLQQEGSWQAHVLDREAETLSIAIADLTGDGQSEIWVANDFALNDKVWQRNGATWDIVQLFDQTSHSTMTTEWGDLDNNGGLTLFTTDMNPYDISPHTLAAWVPMMNQIEEHRAADDPQVMANVLQVRDGAGRWQNQATRRGIDASGWSWGARYGDLDQDGLLDLYVVNGMIAADMFGHLPNGELVEQNQAYRNRGDGAFDRAPQWQLGSTASGRGMVMADMDNDGDLDIVVNNLRGFAQLFENQLCHGASLQVDLAWPGSANRAGVGAQLTLSTDQGVLRRDVRASGGYLSGDAARVHFGLPADAALRALEIVWPDGATSTIMTPSNNARLIVTRSDE